MMEALFPAANPPPPPGIVVLALGFVLPLVLPRCLGGSPHGPNGGREYVGQEMPHPHC